MLEKLKEAGMQLNIDKSYFAKSSVDYLGYIINREGIKPQTSKVQIIVNMPRPKTVTQAKRFAGMINFYRNIWKGRAHHLAPSMSLTKGKKKGPIVWTVEAEEPFENIKKICAEDAMLYYPDFNEEF